MASTPKPRGGKTAPARKPPPASSIVRDSIPMAVVNDRGAERLLGGHPWVYAGDILGWEPEPPPETRHAPVRMRDRRGKELGLADFSPHSQIRLRRLSADAGTVADESFFRERIEAALAWRRSFVKGSDAYRLISAEGDGLPGLIVDRYGDACSVQTLTWAMDARLPIVVQALDALIAPKVLAERNDVKVRELEGLPLRSSLLRGDSEFVPARINGLQFEFDLLQGQKTGSFLDQRENWAEVARRAAELGAAQALDVFTYQGGFALHLARVCRNVEAVDSSRPALEAGERNAQRNQIDSIDWVEANAFDLLRDYERAGRQFDLIVLDPPAFAKSRKALDSAIAGYKEINLRALKMLRPGGLLVSCSCSHHLAEATLLELIADAARDAHRELTVLERRTQSLDHPVLLAMPETFYLKCILAVAR